MTQQWWSWALTAVGLTCFWLAGRKIWWAWYVGIAGQTLWLAYALVTGQLGFLVGVVAYTAVYVRNQHRWTAEHFAQPRHVGRHRARPEPRETCPHCHDRVRSERDHFRSNPDGTAVWWDCPGDAESGALPLEERVRDGL